jgi:small subunit ribosomal protein S11
MVKKETKKKTKKKIARSYEKVRLNVQATFNNTAVTATDFEGKVIAWETAGSAGFKGTRKSTPFAATTTVERLVGKLKEKGVREVEVYIKGPGPGRDGRDAALRVVRAARLKIGLIADVTPIPHNGTRPKKKRRV